MRAAGAATLAIAAPTLTRAEGKKLVTLFLCGDVMTGRGIDQVLPHPSDPRIFERYAKDANASMVRSPSPWSTDTFGEPHLVSSNDARPMCASSISRQASQRKTNLRPKASTTE
jgi:poly-gamma-glutamate capsule biosynthesis protein CapA/YwtB (metallophosphatase superfamily)